MNASPKSPATGVQACLRLLESFRSRRGGNHGPVYLQGILQSRRVLHVARRSLDIGDGKQNAQQKIDSGQHHIRGVHAVLRHEKHDRDAIAEFLKNRRNHQRPVAERVSGNYKKGNLPSQGRAGKTIEKTGMGDCWWIVPAYRIKHEVEGRNYQHAPDGSDPKDDPGKFQGRSRA